MSFAHQNHQDRSFRGNSKGDNNGLTEALLDEDVDFEKNAVELSQSRLENRISRNENNDNERPKGALRNLVVTSITAEKKRSNEEFQNNTHKSIDFSAQLKALKKRTEVDIPYTITQCEDAMYIDQATVVTLEFHYY